MKFGFKRKYTGIFFATIILLGASIAFFVMGPSYIQEEQLFFIQALAISIVDAFVILLFIFGLYRVNYYLFHDRLEIHRSLRKKVVLNYENIVQINEMPHDTIIFIFGKRPSFKIKYRVGRRTKKYRIRAANHNLLKLVLSNEKQIHLALNK
jgi:hypothetical protein